MNYQNISAEGLGADSKIPIVKMGESAEVFYTLALDMIDEIEKNNAKGNPTVMIIPVGPVGHYPIFVRLVNEKKISLKTCYFINMDEYLEDTDEYVDTKHPLSFRGFMQQNVYGKIDKELVMPEAQRIFPNPKNVNQIGEIIAANGGVDMAIGGIGINGHVAFNEPDKTMSPEEFLKLSTRVMSISEDTRTTNASNAYGGDIENFPTRCVTIGIKEIFGAKKVRLGCFRDWHRAVVRRAAYGEVSTDFPITLFQNHEDVKIYANAVSAQLPH